MRHLPVIDVAHRLVREVACVRCYQRPPGSEAWGPDVVRSCEPSCPLFAHLPSLMALAPTVGDLPGDCERRLNEGVCTVCRLRPSSGEFCADYGARTCPVSRYGAGVLAALQGVVAGPGVAADSGGRP